MSASQTSSRSCAPKRPARRWSAQRSTSSARRASRRRRRARSRPRRRQHRRDRLSFRRQGGPAARLRRFRRCDDRRRLRRRRGRSDSPIDDADAGRGARRARAHLAGSDRRHRRAPARRGRSSASSLREMFEPSAAFERLYAAHSGRCMGGPARSGRARPAPSAESEATRLAVFSLIGQIIYFRIARPAVLRRMEWSDIGPPRRPRSNVASSANLDAALALARKTAP